MREGQGSCCSRRMLLLLALLPPPPPRVQLQQQGERSGARKIPLLQRRHFRSEITMNNLPGLRQTRRMLKHRAFQSRRYHEAAQLCSDALAMDSSGQHYKQPRRACPAVQRGAIESLLLVVEGKAQAQQLLARAGDEMAAGAFARAVDTLSDALQAEPPAAAAAVAATAASAIATLAATAPGSSTAATAAAVSEAERVRIAALRGEAAHKAAESDLRRRGAEAFAGTSYSATVCRALSVSEKAMEENMSESHLSRHLPLNCHVSVSWD